MKTETGTMFEAVRAWRGSSTAVNTSLYAATATSCRRRCWTPARRGLPRPSPRHAKANTLAVFVTRGRR